jgi:flagellar basal-body rod modification protein FlgD
MSAIPGISTGSPDQTTQTTTSSSATLDKDDFLKLFIAQLTHQDPSSPMDANQSMDQMASFSMVEQLTNLSSAMTQSSAIGLIGRTVTYKDKDGALHTGAVEKVATAGGATTLTVDGTGNVTPSSITQVA